MSLVAYDSSDEGSENEEKFKDEAEGNDNAEHNVKDLLSLNMLPRPKYSSSAKTVEENEDDILLKNKTENQLIKPTKKQTVKISVPSLSEFKDIEDEEKEEKPAKIIQPSQKGCGLFAILGAPKQETASKSLIPQTVKNVAARIQQLEITKKSDTSQNDSKMKKPTLDQSYNELSSDDEEDVSVDFFGLDTSKNISDNSVSTLLDLELSSDDVIYKSHSKEASIIKHIDRTTHNSVSINSDNLTNDQSSNSKTLTSNVINLPKEEILLKNKAEVGPKLPVPEQEYNIDTQGNVAFDEKAIEYLCGKRGTKRKEITETEIIEINGEDIKPDKREWLVKALTEEPVQRPVSMQSCGINSQSKKKHQITYLAHQAKAMELELKNQWSENKMARKQAKSKYGF